MRFVGREPELAALRTEAGLARLGRCRVVLVSGEAGVGKSRLIEEFARSLDFRSARVACPRSEDGSTLWPWQMILSELGATVPSTADRSGFPARVAFAEALLGAATAEPTLVVLDDLHRADAASLALLTHLADRAADVAMLIVCAYRDERVLALPTGPAVARIAVPGLAVADVAHLVTDLVGADAPAPLVAQLRRRTDGNPLLIATIAPQLDFAGWAARAAEAAGDADRLTISWPPEVHAAVATRLNPLTGGTRAVLGAASVLGREFDLVLLERITPRSEVDLIDALDEALRHRLLSLRSDQVYRFVRAVDREVLYDDIPTGDRARLHEAAARALLAFGSMVGERGPTIAELAHHLVGATTLGGVERFDQAIAYSVAAGAVASEQLRHHDAVAHYAAALQLAIRAGWEPGGVGRLLVGLGVARLAAGELADGHESLAAATRLGRRSGDPELLGAAALGHGPRPGVGDAAPAPDPELRRLLAEAIDALSTGGAQSTLARLHARLAAELAGTDEARRHAVRAAQAADESGDPRAIAEACLALATVTGPGVDTRPAVRAAVALGDAALECRARLATTAAALAMGDVTSADRELGTVADQKGHPVVAWYAAQAKAHRALLAGRLDDAIAATHAALAMGRQVHPQAASLAHAVQLTTVALVRGTPADVADDLAEIARSTVAPPWLAPLSALVAAHRQEIAVASTLVDELIGELRAERAAHRPPERLWGLTLLVDAAIAVEDEAGLQVLLARLAPYRPNWTVLGEAIANAGPVALVLARAHLAVGNLSAAADDLDTAARTPRIGPWLSHLHLVRATWLAARARPEDREAARREAEAARRIASDNDLTGITAQADALIATLARHRGGELTRREREVAAFAIDGLAARDIADRLFVSERTVETHLANIYRKLNVRSRVELIARFGAGL